MSGTTLTFVWLVAAAASALAVEGVRRLALRYGVMDVPNGRSSHVAPTPRGGGVAVVAACAVGWGAALVAVGWGALGPLAAGTLLIAAVSWADDVRTLAARTRFGVHAAAAGLVVAALGPWGAVAVPFVGEVPVGVWLGAPLALVWAVGLTNAYNFMDGIDGIAGAQAVVAGAAWALAGAALGLPAVALTGALVAGASAGFLGHNWAPARIFMGDVGSAPLGFVFAGLALVAGDAAGGRLPLAGLLFVWPFVFDAAYTFARRLGRGEDVFAAHRSHLYQRMTVAGWSHARVAGLYAAVAAGSAGLGLLWAVRGDGAAAVAALGAVPLALGLAVRRAERRAAPAGEPVPAA